MSSGLGRLLAGIVGAAVSWGAVAAYAQPVAPSRQEVNPEQGVAARARQRPVDMFAAPAAGECPLRDSTLTFTLRSVTVLNSETGSRAAAEAFGDLNGREMKVGEICEIRDRLANLLYGQGILARVLIPEQTIADGALKLDVVEGRIVAVRVRGDVGRGQDKVEDYLEQLRNLTPFDLDTAYRYLHLASRVPGIRIRTALVPSTAGVRGAIDLDVTVERRKTAFLGAVQNHGSKSLGPWGVLARADLNSFTRYGERTSLIAYRTVTANEQWIVQLVEEARIGDSGWIAKASVAYGKSKPGGVLKPLGLIGDSKVATLEASYPLIIHRQGVLTAGGGLEAVNQFTGFPGGGALADDKLRVFWLGLDGDYALGLGERLSLTANGRAEARKGFSWLGGSKAGAPSLSRFEGKPGAWVARFEGEGQLTRTYEQPGAASQLRLKLKAQYAADPLLSYEEMAVGDLTIGMGYEPAVLSGDRVVSAELRGSHTFPVELSEKVQFTLMPFVFGDISRIQNLDTGSESRTLRSAGAGIEAELGKGPFDTRIRASLAWAHPFDKPFPTAPDKPSDRILVQIVISR